MVGVTLIIVQKIGYNKIQLVESKKREDESKLEV
jgi:hypothetical protein